MFIIKGVVSGHYSHISQFTYKCLMWTVIINKDEEGIYVYRSEIWQALKFDFHKQRQNKVCTYSVDFNTFRVQMFDTFREPHFFTFSVIFAHIASIFTFSVEICSHLATFSHIAAFSHLRLPQMLPIRIIQAAMTYDEPFLLRVVK